MSLWRLECLRNQHFEDGAILWFWVSMCSAEWAWQSYVVWTWHFNSIARSRAKCGSCTCLCSGSLQCQSKSWDSLLSFQHRETFLMYVWIWLALFWALSLFASLACNCEDLVCLVLLNGSSNHLVTGTEASKKTEVARSAVEMEGVFLLHTSYVVTVSQTLWKAL